MADKEPVDNKEPDLRIAERERLERLSFLPDTTLIPIGVLHEAVLEAARVFQGDIPAVEADTAPTERFWRLFALLGVDEHNLPPRVPMSGVGV